MSERRERYDCGQGRTAEIIYMAGLDKPDEHGRVGFCVAVTEPDNTRTGQCRFSPLSDVVRAHWVLVKEAPVTRPVQGVLL